MTAAISEDRGVKAHDGGESTRGRGPLPGGLWPWVLQGRKTTEALQIAMAAFDAGVPVMLVSGPGKGKTATIQALIQTLGWKSHYMSMASLSFDDVSGNPRAVDYDGPARMGDAEQNKQTVYAMPGWQWSLLEQDHEGGVRTALIVDELNTASRATLKTFLPIFQSKALPAGPQFRADTPIIGALNPTDQSDGYELSMAMQNRLLWLAWEPDAKEMGDGFEARWVSEEKMRLPVTLDPEADADEILKRERAYAKVARQYRDDAMGGDFSRPPEASEAADNGLTADEAFVSTQAWSSDRSWDNLVRILARIPEEAITRTLLDALVYGTVGRRWGSAFSAIMYGEIMGQATTMIKYTTALEDFDSVDWGTLSAIDLGLVKAGVAADVASGDADRGARAVDLLTKIHDANASLDDPTVVRAVNDDVALWTKTLGKKARTLRPAFTARFDEILSLGE